MLEYLMQMYERQAVISFTDMLHVYHFNILKIIANVKCFIYDRKFVLDFDSGYLKCILRNHILVHLLYSK